MFLVFNKEKIYSYIIAVLTVVVLFTVSEIYIKDERYVETSGNITNQEINENKVENVVNGMEEKAQINKK